MSRARGLRKLSSTRLYLWALIVASKRSTISWQVHAKDSEYRLNLHQTCLPRFNGNLDRAHRTDDQEFHQLLYYTELKARLAVWERFHNLSMPHGMLEGKDPTKFCVKEYKFLARCCLADLKYNYM